MNLPERPLTFADIRLRCKPLQISLRALSDFTHLPNRTYFSALYKQEHNVEMNARYIIFAGGIGWERTLLELREAQWEVCLWDREPLYGHRANNIGWHGVCKFSKRSAFRWSCILILFCRHQSINGSRNYDTQCSHKA